MAVPYFTVELRGTMLTSYHGNCPASFFKLIKNVDTAMQKGCSDSPSAWNIIASSEKRNNFDLSLD
jgi:hypothetical protein